MAKDKNKVIIYADWITTFDALTDDEAGKLIKHLMHYINDRDPKSDRLIELVFEPMKQTLKRDLKKWEQTCERNKINGSKGGRPKTEKTHEIPVGFSITDKNPNKPDSDSDSDSDNDNDLKNNQSKIDFVFLLEFFNQTFGKRSRIIPPKVLKAYTARIKEGYTIDDISSAMLNASRDKFHRENNFQHCTMEFFSRAEKIDKFASSNPKQNERYIPTR